MPAHRHAMTVAAALLAASAAHAAPPIPTNVTAAARAEGGATVTWTGSEQALSYRVYSATGAEIAEVLTTSYDAAPGFRGFAVSACDALGGCSILSSPVARVPGARQPTVPISCDAPLAADEVPGNVTVEFSASGGGRVRFDAVPNADAYLLHVNGEYATFVEAAGPLAFDLVAPAAMDARYQVSAEIGGVYFPKSAPAIAPQDMAVPPAAPVEPAEPSEPATPAPTTPSLCEAEQEALRADLTAARARIADLEAASPDGGETSAQLTEARELAEERRERIEVLDAVVNAQDEEIRALEAEKATLVARVTELEAQVIPPPPPPALSEDGS